VPPPKDPERYKKWIEMRREANRGEKNPFFGKHHSEETKQKIRENRRRLFGEDNPMFGRRGEDSPHWGSKRTEEVKKRMGLSISKALKGKFEGAKNPNWKGGPVLVRCSNCGRPLLRSRITLGKNEYFYCNIKCQGQWRSRNWTGSSNPRYLPGKQRFYSEDFNSQLKELIRLRDGYRCQKCGCSGLKNGQKLSVHHIDYNKENSLPLNLISLCRACNVAVNFNRKKWIRYFKRILNRHSRNGTQLYFRSCGKLRYIRSMNL